MPTSIPLLGPILGGASALGGIGAAAIGANAQTENAQRAIQAQEQLFGQGLTQAGNYFGSAQNALQPFITGGSNALNAYNAALPGLTTPFDASSLTATPGYEFTLDQGLQATQNSFAAQGLGSSGAALRGAAAYATGDAQNTYNQQLQNYLSQNQLFGSLLYQPVQAGVGAAGALGSIAGSIGTAALGGAVNTGSGIANSYTGIGNAIAGAATGASNSLTGGINNALQYSLLSPLYQAYTAQLAGTSGLPASINQMYGQNAALTDASQWDYLNEPQANAYTGFGQSG